MSLKKNNYSFGLRNSLISYILEHKIEGYNYLLLHILPGAVLGQYEPQLQMTNVSARVLISNRRNVDSLNSLGLFHCGSFVTFE